jgi:hypothetical protein
MRGPGESYSDVIVRLAAAKNPLTAAPVEGAVAPGREKAATGSLCGRRRSALTSA